VPPRVTDQLVPVGSPDSSTVTEYRSTESAYETPTFTGPPETFAQPTDGVGTYEEALPFTVGPTTLETVNGELPLCTEKKRRFPEPFEIEPVCGIPPRVTVQDADDGSPVSLNTTA